MELVLLCLLFVAGLVAGAMFQFAITQKQWYVLCLIPTISICALFVMSIDVQKALLAPVMFAEFQKEILSNYDCYAANTTYPLIYSSPRVNGFAELNIVPLNSTNKTR